MPDETAAVPPPIEVKQGRPPVSDETRAKLLFEYRKQSDAYGRKLNSAEIERLALSVGISRAKCYDILREEGIHGEAA